MTVSESEMEDLPLLRDEFKGGMHDSITEVDLFLENCSSLYNLVLDSLHDLSSKSVTWQSLDDMANGLEEAGKRLAKQHPDMEGTVLLRVNTISSAMEQLKLRKCAASDTESCSSRSQASSEVRSWIHSMEKRLMENEESVRQRKTHRATMTKLLADQQVLQLEIQTEGQALISRLYNQFRADSGGDTDSEQFRRKKSTIDAIRKKWHTVYLNSLCLQCRIEEIVNKYQEESESDTDSELAGPPTKRARRSSLSPSETTDEEEDEDTLPFADCEYESIMDGGRTTVTSVSSEDSPVRTKKWDSVQQDIGYSSGENSIHEALNTIGERIPDTRDSMIRRLEASPAKTFYRMVLDDMSDVEVKKALEFANDDVINTQLTDSMHVNYEQNSVLVLPEYDEVMALMDGDDDLLPKEGMNDSFNTQWREIRGRQSTRKTRLSKEQLDVMAKNSCDASSEDSSDWETREEANAMSRSYNSAMLDGSCHSLKRQRGNRKSSNFLLDCSEMDASFCSTRSDMPPCMNRSFMRKKLRVRRLPRSMSDGEQLGVKSGLLTPTIRVSPPRTPLSSSTRLLQQLDQQLLMSELSDTAPEQSDAPVYEWDEYNPPEKDDTIPDTASNPSKIAEEMLDVDEDFGTHFGYQATSNRLLNESRAHLRVVEKCIENGDVDHRQMANIELICRTNLRQLDTAIQMTSLSHGGEELRSLRQQWSRLVKSVSNPASQLLSQVGRFASSLRDLHDASSVSALNGVTDIRSKDDVRRALDTVTIIQKRLSGERDELRSLLDSKLFKHELSEVSGEFEVISLGYDDAVTKIDGLAASLSKLNDDWTQWSDQQNDIRRCMSTIEEKLKATNVDQVTVLSQMEMCQERMDSLETMCNYLTSSLQTIQEDGSSKIIPDFKSEIMLYANALEQLKTKFHDLTRVPSPPTPSTPLMTSTPLKRRNAVASRSQPTQTATPTPVEATTRPLRRASLGSRIYRAISSSWIVKGLLALSVVSALAALFWAGILGTTFGPHLRYVNGPPPM